jgi:hypothetical protein
MFSQFLGVPEQALAAGIELDVPENDLSVYHQFGWALNGCMMVWSTIRDWRRDLELSYVNKFDREGRCTSVWGVSNVQSAIKKFKLHLRSITPLDDHRAIVGVSTLGESFPGEMEESLLLVNIAEDRVERLFEHFATRVLLAQDNRLLATMHGTLASYQGGRVDEDLLISEQTVAELLSTDKPSLRALVSFCPYRLERRNAPSPPHLVEIRRAKREHVVGDFTPLIVEKVPTGISYVKQFSELADGNILAEVQATGHHAYVIISRQGEIVRLFSDIEAEAQMIGHPSLPVILYKSERRFAIWDYEGQEVAQLELGSIKHTGIANYLLDSISRDGKMLFISNPFKQNHTFFVVDATALDDICGAVSDGASAHSKWLKQKKKAESPNFFRWKRATP